MQPIEVQMKPLYLGHHDWPVRQGSVSGRGSLTVKAKGEEMHVFSRCFILFWSAGGGGKTDNRVLP